MLVILVTGMPGSGKEEFLSVAKKMDIPFLRMGDLVRNAYAKNDVASTGISIGEFASAQREEFGKNIWAKRALELMSGNIFLVDGCRSMDEITSYRELSDKVKIVAIHSSPETRYTRLIKRAREDAPHNVEEFNTRDNREMSWGLGNVIALADIILDNSASLEKFHADACTLLEKIQ